MLYNVWRRIPLYSCNSSYAGAASEARAGVLDVMYSVLYSSAKLAEKGPRVSVSYGVGYKRNRTRLLFTTLDRKLYRGQRAGPVRVAGPGPGQNKERHQTPCKPNSFLK